MNPRFAVALFAVVVLIGVRPLSAQPTSTYIVEQGDGTILRYDDLSASGNEVVRSSDAGSPVRIALDHVNSKVYWTDKNGRILRVNRNGSAVETIVDGLDNPVGLAVDGEGGYVYWTDAVVNEIYRKHLSEGSSIETLIASSNCVDGPLDLQLDVQEGKMYWVNFGVAYDEGDSDDPDDDVGIDGSICRANLDGSEDEAILTDLYDPTGLALDVEKGRVYWVDRGVGLISKARFNGSDIDPLIDNAAPRGIALDLHAGHMYWTYDPGGSTAGKIYRSNLAGNQSSLESLTTGLNRPVGIALNTEAPLPVELTAFNAVATGDDIVLSWATASETNNAGFEVEWARNGAAFEQVGFVESHGDGTTNEPQQYTHRVVDVRPGAYTLRLKQVDADGTSAYSPEVEVQVGIEAAYTLSAPYPNPFAVEAAIDLTVREPQHVTVAVYNALGQRVRTLFEGPAEAHSPQTFRLEAQGLSSGTYLYRVVGETFTETRTITLVK